jgi:Protein of unknown function (DUF2569)
MSDTHEAGPAGLGGWLVLVGLGLVSTPISVFVFLLQNFPPLFSDGTWAALPTPGSETYHPLWAPLFIFEIVGNLAFVLTGLWLLTLFFRRSNNFPTVFIWFVSINVLFILVDAWLGSFVLPEEPMFDPATTQELARSVVSSAVWVPYMLSSKRVRNTFVVRRAAAQQEADPDR